MLNHVVYPGSGVDERGASCLWLWQRTTMREQGHCELGLIDGGTMLF